MMTAHAGHPFCVRPYTRGDDEAIRALHRLALRESGADRGPGPWDDDLNDITGSYLDAGGAFLVGTLEERIVAMGALARIDETTAAMRRMRVHPQFQRRGFGQTILLALEHRARDLGYTKLVLDTTAQQTAAQALYRKHGYQEVRRGAVAGFVVLYFEKRAFTNWSDAGER